MKRQGAPPFPAGNDDELATLIATLHETDRRLDDLTGGEVDAVADPQGRTFLLRRAQDRLRLAEAAKQAGILNALPAHIAVLDARGAVVSVNEAWQRFGAANVPPAPGASVGAGYLELCDVAGRDGYAQASEAARGIRSVLEGAVKTFAMEYPCHSQSDERRLRLVATPLADGAVNGAVVMHIDVTAERKMEEDLRVSESRFRQIAESIRQVFFLRAADGSRVLYVSPAYAEIFGRSCESLYRKPESWTEAIHPDDRAQVREKSGAGAGGAEFSLEYRILRPDGSTRWIESRGFPVQDGAGRTVRIAGIAEDITQRKEAQDQLLRFGAAMDITADAIYLVDRASMSFVYVNDTACRMQGQTREALLARGPADLLGMSREALERTYDAVIAGGVEANPVELERERPDGSRVWVELRRHAHRSDERWTLVTLVRDITERKDADRRIRRLNRVFAVLSGINTLIVRVREQGELFREACRIAVEAGDFKLAWIGVVDPQTRKLLPVASAGLAQDYLELMPLAIDDSDAGRGLPGKAVSENRAVIVNDIASDDRMLLRAEALRRGFRSLVLLPLAVSGTVTGVFALYADSPDFFDEAEMELLRELAGDISFALEHIEKADRLAYLAYYDDLTGMANRTLFLERVSQYLRSAAGRGHGLAVFLVDLDRFKNINDSLGQAAGDELLRQVGKWLARRAGDAALVARLGADIFAVVVPEVREGGNLVGLLEREIKTFVSYPFPVNGAQYRIGVKAGAAISGANADADTLLKHAEAALKGAKARGEPYLFYTSEMTARTAVKLTLENQLRQALDNEEFVLHYQPKVSLDNGRLTGAEALIRWNDPRTGLVPPARFIPVLEETGLIYEVGRWALGKAIDEYLRWLARGLAAVPISVNVSPLQLRNRDFVREVECAVGIAPEAAAGLELEITESLIMEDVKRSIESLAAIRAMGVKIAIDDFGTGFSSLSYLAKLPVDTLKIDRSFVVDMTEGPDGFSLVSTIITLAHSMKLKVVAEGVETDVQSRLLRSLRCDEAQGYLFSKPVPSEAFGAQFLGAQPAA